MSRWFSSVLTLVMMTCMPQRPGLHLEVFIHVAMSDWNTPSLPFFPACSLRGFSSGMLLVLTLLACCGPPNPSKLRKIHSCLRKLTCYKTFSKVQLGFFILFCCFWVFREHAITLIIRLQNIPLFWRETHSSCPPTSPTVLWQPPANFYISLGIS